MHLTDGSPEPLGVSVCGGGVNIAVHAPHATAVELCLFDDADTETARVVLPARTGGVWHGHVAGIGPGARYGLRAHGPFDPARGMRFNARKLLVDPYALELDRAFVLHPAMFENADDSAAFMPKAVVTRAGVLHSPSPSGEGDSRGERGGVLPEPPQSPTPVADATRPPQEGREGRAPTPWRDTMIYELHVRGFTMAMPGIPDAIRGTFAALGHPAAVAHLTRLGVTAVELLPTAAWIDERHLGPLGLTNYWGYNSVAFLAPDPRLAPGGWAEVRGATAALAAAGIETLLDVVYNHTGEGDALGPVLCLRGLDNCGYYRLRGDDPAAYVDDTGTGNTLALDRPPAVRLVMDSLRAWRRLGGVAGFRFDLATVLGRRAEGFDPDAPLLTAIDQDPELRGLKLIAEPWDVGPGGYQLGGFAPAWGEWNDKFRDDARGFWRGDGVTRGVLARRLAGSQDVFHARPPSRGVNFITAHDGFTLADLVSYETKHNAANGEQNRDGTGDNRAWNCGVEGPSDDPAIRERRRADQRALLATLILARGTPMLSMGAEFGQTQGGNNNAYAQDNAISWLDWAAADQDLIDFTARLIAIRRDHPALTRDRFLTDADVTWLGADGAALTAEDWDDPAGATLAMVLGDVAVILHRADQPARLALPAPTDRHAWTVLADSADPARTETLQTDALTVAPRCVVVLGETSTPGRPPRGVTRETLDALAAAAGIAPDWWSVDGERTAVTPDTQRALLAAMRLECGSEAQAREALHFLNTPNDPSSRTVGEGAEASGVCHLPAVLADGGRAFGISAQLYALKRDGDQGIGDFSTLAALTKQAERAGAAAVAINPLHALFPHRRDRASPYYPSDRRFIDPIYLDVGAAPPSPPSPFGEGDSAKPSGVGRFGSGALRQARQDPTPLAPRVALPMKGRENLIDYPAVWAAKSAALEAGFAAGQTHPDFATFAKAASPALRRFATFQAIAETLNGAPWQTWPAALRDPATARADAVRVRYHLYLQWLCETRLAAAAGDLRIGLIRDLAIGAAPDGAEIWAHQDLYATGVSVGAPPDPLGPQGQVWGLPPLDPHRIAKDDYAFHTDLFAANMRHAGGLRIDHALGLMRQFWVPDGADGSAGAYVSFPFDELMAVLARESRKAQCLIIGEDLGTVPDGFRERMSAAHALSYRVLTFERRGAGFIPPADYPALAVACVATHDLPPLAGWWSGVDIDERAALGLLSPDDAASERAARAADKAALLAALGRPADSGPATSPALAAAVHAFIAATPCALTMIQAEDLAGETVPVNLPGTDAERPNWRRRINVAVEDMLDGERATAILQALGPRALRP